MGKPAARITDMHICPKVNPGPVPHVGGPIVMGSPNVLIGSLPAARVGDMAICVGPPDKVSAGSSGVLINGKQAARLGDSTAHGGKIIIGMPTVLVGGGGGGGSGGGESTDTNISSSVVAGGDVGSSANYVADALAQSLIASATLAEPETTRNLQKLSSESGSKMEGLDYKLKGQDSLSRKITTDSIKQNISMNEAAGNTSDVLRYTMIVDEDKFGDTANDVMTQLEKDGYKKVKVKNTFKEGEIYKGINTNYETPDGQPFELQFHTEKSFDTKQNINHALYEEQRLPNVSATKQAELASKMKANSDVIPQPKGVENIKIFP